MGATDKVSRRVWQGARQQQRNGRDVLAAAKNRMVEVGEEGGEGKVGSDTLTLLVHRTATKPEP